jgi:hypothetical protein
MRMRTKWKKQAILGTCVLALAIVPPVMEAAGSAGDTIVPGKFHFTTFDVPNQISLGVEAINISGVTVGYYQSGTVSSPGPYLGFLRIPNETLLTLRDPLDLEKPSDPNGGLTIANGINDQDTVAGEYFDSAAGHYAGFLLQHGVYTSYNVPGYFNTVNYGINDFGQFCGLAQGPPPGFVSNGFVNLNGYPTIITIPRATFSSALAINNLGQLVGEYVDTAGVYHGYFRDAKGKLSLKIDAPGASSVPGFGSIPLGVNDLGMISGHFFDSSLNEHGFVRLPNGVFLQIDVPGAAQTSGGGLNDLGLVAGHYVDKGGVFHGYIAIPEFPLP